MSLILNTIFHSASTTDSPLYLLELACAAWPAPLRYAVSAQDETVTLPSAETAVFLSSGLAVALPDQSASGSQDMVFQFDGVSIIALEYIDLAIADYAEVTATLYTYTHLHRDAPQKSPLTLQVVSAVADKKSFQAACKHRDVINSPFPKLRYTPKITPGLKYYA